jgi:hypothetical protein
MSQKHFPDAYSSDEAPSPLHTIKRRKPSQALKHAHPCQPNHKPTSEQNAKQNQLSSSLKFAEDVKEESSTPPTPTASKSTKKTSAVANIGKQVDEVSVRNDDNGGSLHEEERDDVNQEEAPTDGAQQIRYDSGGNEIDWAEVPISTAIGCAPPPDVYQSSTAEPEAEMDKAALLPLPDFAKDDEEGVKKGVANVGQRYRELSFDISYLGCVLYADVPGAVQLPLPDEDDADI